MIRGSLTDLEIFVARENVVGGFNRLKAKAAQIEGVAWQMFYAGAMSVSVKHFDRQLAELGVVMSDGKPTVGTVIEPDIPSDLCDASMEDACKAIQNVGSVPRRLLTGSEKYYENLRRKYAERYELSAEVDHDYGPDEWSVDDLGEGDQRITYWVPGF